MCKDRFAVSILKAALLATALVAGVATEAAAQATISGRVTSAAAPGGLQNTVLQFHEVNSNSEGPSGTATTNASGDYTSPTLPPGTYAVLTQDTHGYINEIWNNVTCSITCDTNSAQLLALTTVAITGIDFVLEPGGRISGTVIDAGTSLPIAGIRVNFAAAGGGLYFTSAVTDLSGNYISEGGSAAGSVFAVTQNSLGYRNEVFDNIYCLGCDPTTTGTPIPVTLGNTTPSRNFALDPGGRIAGTVRNIDNQPLANVEINISDSTGNRIDSIFTDASGNFSSAGLPSGTYYANTFNSQGYADELYSDFLCPGGSCNPVNGTAIPVTVPGTATIAFVLAPGGTFTGTVTNGANSAAINDAQVSIYSSGGLFLTNTRTNLSGVYTTPSLAPGAYKAQTFNVPGYQNQLYNGIACGGGCTVTSGNPITVTASLTTLNINFALQPAAAGGISGLVTSGVTPQSNFQVQLYSSGGSFMSSVNTNGSGNYTFSAVSPGSYYVRTSGTGNLINELYNNVTCISCSVTGSGGSLVAVATSTITGIDFNLAVGGQISGTVTKASDSLGIQNVSVQIYNSTGSFLGSFNTNASGNYITSGLPGTPATTYYVKTFNSQGFVDELYDNIPCSGCSVTTGAPITVNANSVTSPISFVLAAGVGFTGTVTNAGNGALLQGVRVQVYNSVGGFLTSVSTNASGVYTVSGLAAGATHYARTVNGLGFADKLYNNVSCNYGCSATTGTAIVVGSGTQTGINFSLVAAVFTDDPLVLGGTMIKAAHITELRYRINGLRTRFSLSFFTWTDPVIQQGVTVIRAQHILDLRQALVQVYAAAAQTSPTYTDPSLGTGASIKAAHVAELRAAAIFIEIR